MVSSFPTLSNRSEMRESMWNWERERAMSSDMWWGLLVALSPPRQLLSCRCLSLSFPCTLSLLWLREIVHNEERRESSCRCHISPLVNGWGRGNVHENTSQLVIFSGFHWEFHVDDPPSIFYAFFYAKFIGFEKASLYFYFRSGRRIRDAFLYFFLFFSRILELLWQLRKYANGVTHTSNLP